MRVLLIWPRNPEAVLSDALSCCEPLPLEYLAGAIAADHDVTIHDGRMDPPLASLASVLCPDVVGIAIPFTSSAWAARATSQEARRLWPNAVIVLGGHHPTVSTEWMDGYAADYVVRGEGGLVLRHLCEDLERLGRVRVVPGLVPYADFAAAPKAPTLATFDQVPAPDRTLLAHQRASYFHSVYRPVALMRLSAGCPFQCSFCVLWRLTERRYVTKAIPRIIDELQSIDVESVYVTDDEAFIQPARMLLLAQAIEQAGIRKRFHMYVRTDTALRHPEVIERWAAVGLDSVLVGAESMDDAELQEYTKGTTSNDTRDAIRLFHANGIKVRANFIVRPEYTHADFDRLARTVTELQVDLPTFAVLTPLPGTRLRETCHHQIVDDNPDLYDCYHALLPTHLASDDFYDRFASLWRSAAERPAPGPATDPGVFYYSSSGAFERMLAALRDGPAMHRRSWRAPRESSSLAVI